MDGCATLRTNLFHLDRGDRKSGGFRMHWRKIILNVFNRNERQVSLFKINPISIDRLFLLADFFIEKLFSLTDYFH